MATLRLAAIRSRLWPFFNWDVVRIALALVLLGAAGLKSWELVRNTPTLDRVWFPRPFLVMLVFLEIAFGFGLLANTHPRWNRIATLLLFIGFFEFNLYLALAGYRSCPCLGGIHVSPWVMGGFDAAVALMLLWVPPGPGPTYFTRRLGLCLFAYGLLAGPLAILFANPLPQGVIHELRNDSRLRELIPLDLRNPDNKTLFELLNKKIGLTLTADENLAGATSEMGRVNTKLAAWAIMEFIALKTHPARWEKNGEGYHLAASPSWGTNWITWLLSLGALVLTAAGFWLCFRGGRYPGASSESKEDSTALSGDLLAKA